MIDPTDQSVIPPKSGIGFGSGSGSGLRIALAHDWLIARRGGELVLDAITTHLHQSNNTLSTIYTMFDSGTPITPAIDTLTRTTSSLNRLPKPLRRWLLPLYPKAIEQLSTRLASDHASQPIDLLISTSSSAIKALAPPPGVPHLCYCHAPARYLWSQSDQYTMQAGFKSKLRAAGLDHFGNQLRAWDQSTTPTVTQFIANSHFIAKQIQQIYNRDAVVIHPPVRTDYFTPSESNAHRTDHLLYVGALEPYKRVDLAMDAAILLGTPLHIVGTGSQAKALQSKANNAPNITMHNHLNDNQVRELFRSCRALIQPQVEDFGITAVEAQACGCPIVARRAGGSLETVIETKTGSFFDAPDHHELADAIERLPTSESVADDCRRNALRFSYEAFTAKLDAVIESITKPACS